MILYLVQRGKAEARGDNEPRTLTEKGRRELTLMVDFIARRNIENPIRICHSGKIRASQTAELLASGFKMEPELLESDALSPMDDPTIWAGRLEDEIENLMLVGHMPHISRLTSLLLTGDADTTPVQIRNGGIVCLYRDPGRHWALEWYITPYLLA